MGFDEQKQLWWIPSGGFYKVNLVDYKDTRPNIPLNNVAFKGVLRPEQVIIQDKMLKNGKLYSGLIQAKCGFGKTFLGSSLIGSYGHSALVLTHTKLLQDQWLEHCNKFIEGSTIGEIGGGIYRPAPITVGLYLSVGNHLEELMNQFSVVIVDECHKAPARIFSSVVNGLNAKVKIGLSATPRRKDGWHELLPDFFGPNHVIADNPGATMPIKKVYIIQTPIHLNIKNPIKDWVRCVSYLAQNEDYIKYITKWTTKKIAEKRCVLLVNERLEALRRFNLTIPKSKLLIGETPDAEREHILTNAGNDIDAILSNKIFYEGVSCNRLDTLGLTSPTNNPITLEQILGRIQRLHPDKQEPEVLDFWYKGFVVQRTQFNRQYWYAKEGIPFEVINDDEFNSKPHSK